MSTLKIPVSQDDHKQGNLDAPVRLVEYGDYQCPFCAAAHPVVKMLQKHYGEQLCFVFRNFPLTEVHPLAEPAAEAAEFATDFDRFWEMHDSIFENHKILSLGLLIELGEKLGLNPQEL